MNPETPSCSCLCIESLWVASLPWEDQIYLPAGGYREHCFLCSDEGVFFVTTSGGIKRYEPMTLSFASFTSAQTILALWLLDEVVGSVAKLLEIAKCFKDETIVKVINEKLRTRKRIDLLLYEVVKGKPVPES